MFLKGVQICLAMLSFCEAGLVVRDATAPGGGNDYRYCLQQIQLKRIAFTMREH